MTDPSVDETVSYDDPSDVAHRIDELPRPVLIAFDCDGVLAPLVGHADDAVLLDDVGALLDGLAGHADVILAVVSGRSLAGLEQFEFDDTIILIGSHGAERRNHPMPALTAGEAARLQRLEAIAVAACKAAGDGAWIERKPASVVVHVVQADATEGERALEGAADAATDVTGSVAVPGRAVMELLARPTNKGRALDELRTELDPASVVYFGDDVTDEHAFAVLRPNDVGVKVGPAPTAATARLADPEAVRTLLQIITTTP